MAQILNSAVLLICISIAFAQNPFEENVVTLTDDNFDRLVIKSNDTWVVNFYAPWCFHSRRFLPKYEEIGRSLKNIVKVGSVDTEENPIVSDKYNITRIPSIRFFKADKSKPESYIGNKTRDDVVEAVMKIVEKDKEQN